MIDTLIYGTASLEYSYSTEVRDEMIKEAFHFFLNNPIFGNGWNYFYAHTMYGYEYSHCNYTELLCSFGILGTLLFYSKYFSNLFVMIKNIHNKFIHKDLLVLIFILTVEALLLDWAAVTFSAQCIWYLPVIIASSSASVLSKLNGRKT